MNTRRLNSVVERILKQFITKLHWMWDVDDLGNINIYKHVPHTNMYEYVCTIKIYVDTKKYYIPQ